MDERFEAPEHLSDRAKALWLDLVPEQARSTGRLALLRAALESLDRADSAREAIAGGSLTTTTKSTGAVHLHPLLRVEREARQQFANIWSTLNFQWSKEDAVDYEHWKRTREREAAR